MVASLLSFSSSEALAQSFYYSYGPGGSIGKISTNGVVTPFVSSPGDIANYITTDSAGNIYQANQSTKTIVKITPDGSISDYATSPLFSSPSGLAFDTSGNLYVADYNWVNQASLWQVAPNGSVSLFTTFGGGGALTYNPVTGDFYAGNYAFGNIYKITSSGVVSSIATVQSPNFLATDANGNVFVTSQGYANTTPYITKITPEGQTSTYWTAGTYEGKYLGGITFDNIGDLYGFYGDELLKFSDNGSASAFSSVGGGGLAFVVPEPSTYALLLLSGAASLWALKRRKS